MKHHKNFFLIYGYNKQLNRWNKLVEYAISLGYEKLDNQLVGNNNIRFNRDGVIGIYPYNQENILAKNRTYKQIKRIINNLN